MGAVSEYRNGTCGCLGSFAYLDVSAWKGRLWRCKCSTGAFATNVTWSLSIGKMTAKRPPKLSRFSFHHLQ